MVAPASLRGIAAWDDMMTVLRPLLACTLCVGLAACDNWNTRQGVGFTGLSSEPRSLPADSGGMVTRGVAVPVALAGLPPVRVQAGAGSMDQLAGAAIAAGGRSPASAVPVGGQSGTMMLSTVEVNGQPFAVLLPPEDARTRMVTGAQGRFQSSVLRLTGCKPAGPAYAAGSAARPSGLAVPLNCL